MSADRPTVSLSVLGQPVRCVRWFASHLHASQNAMGTSLCVHAVLDPSCGQAAIIPPGSKGTLVALAAEGHLQRLVSHLKRRYMSATTWSPAATASFKHELSALTVAA